ncbi:MAG: putative zinc-binding protein [Chloroflexi bacterium]|nr:putative zinc-binding protein [Chloroflexota bacterium]
MTDKPGRTAIFPCSGGSNCGQIANEVGIKLTEDGLGNMGCLGGIGAHDEKMIDGAKTADRVLAIDGCAVACAKKTLEHAGISVTQWICVTDYGIKKTPNKFEIKREEMERVIVKTREKMSWM